MNFSGGTRSRSPARPPTGSPVPHCVSAQGLGERVMARHRMLLSAFLAQPDRPSGAACREISTFIFNASMIRAKA
jgi:hypothetical protein